MNGRSTSYGGFLPEIAARFQRRFDEIVVVENFDSGPEFEIALCDVLRKVLPRRVGVCRGYVVDRAGAQQGDDIIVFDAARFPTLRSLGDDLSKKEHVPADAVLAYIEAKHTLYLEPPKKSEGQSLIKAISQVAAVKSLSRTTVEISEAIPGVKLTGPMALVRDVPGWPNKLNPWYGMILARHFVTKSSQPRLALAEALAKLAPTVTTLPDFIAAKDLVAFPAILGPRGDTTKPPDATVRPFICDGTELIVSQASGLAFGIATIQLLWALERIVLGRIPWEEMVIEALGEWSYATPSIRSRAG